ncbi:peptidoglycan-binding protein [Sulfobacillus harzensis]|uniref:Peptidoglycan-binding protein n=1 Tax=Sulfobacillus harzensis TaxID=2729629 RepID=A0A7Y0L169_9FIRM|nr:peptidoglycan-binding protein [Sulfobacillus harzensis]NMP20846.1 peptidoglycan-binding protein [Sulfobacillus harzensis]
MMIKGALIGAAMLSTLGISAPSWAATKSTTGVVSTTTIAAQHPALQQRLQYGDRGHWVMTLQADLNGLGVVAGPVDGVFGPKTETGVKHFQQLHHLPVTGIANGATWQDLLAGYGITPPVSNQVVSASQAVPAANAKTIDGRPILHVYHMIATAYGPSLQDNYPYGPTDAFGQPLQPGMIAVDPSVIPLRSSVYVAGYHDANLPTGGFLGHAMDTGGAIQGMRIDIFMNDNAQTISNFGIQPVTVYVLGK